jgi:hypothetical protein
VSTIDPIELGKWLRGECRRSKLARFSLGFWHNYIPKLFGWTVSPLRIVFGSIRGVFFLFVSLSPIWIKFYDHTSTLTWTEAITYSVILFAMLVYNFLYDKIVKEYKPKSVANTLKRKLSLELGGVANMIGELVRRKSKEHATGVDAATGKILECIRDGARIYLGDYEGAHVEVTLLVFDDPQCEAMKIANRTTRSRPIGKVKKSEEIMAYYVAKGRKHEVVHDFLADPHPFPKTSLSGDTASYRSLLMVPLLDTASGGPDDCVGVVTVDSSRPYHFWPGLADGLVVELKAYLSLLVLLLNLNEPNRLKQEAP